MNIDDHCEQLHIKLLNDRWNRLLNSLSKNIPERICLDNYEPLFQQYIIEKLGEAIAKYFNNITRLTTGEEDIKESFYIGNNPINCSFILVNVWKLGICVEKLGAAQNYIPIRMFIDEFCDETIHRILERIIFEHC